MVNINLLPVEYKEKQKFNLKRVLIILFIILLTFGTVYLLLGITNRLQRTTT